MSQLLGKPIRGLTLWRPWPWTFMHADKRVENRPWAPPPSMLGGFLALHAGHHYDYDAHLMMKTGVFGAAARSVPAPIDHPEGVIVAVAVLQSYETIISTDLSKPWAFGPVVWHLTKIVPLVEPIACRGRQKLWKVPSDVLDDLARQYAVAA